MKAYISCDVEGISGVVSSEETPRGNKEYERARKLMTEEVNAAIEGALVGGAREIVVNDAGGPVALVVGDRLLVEEARALLGPSLETVMAKEGDGTRAAQRLNN